MIYCIANKMMLASLNMLCVPRIYDAHMTYTGSALVAPQVCRRVRFPWISLCGEPNAVNITNFWKKWRWYIIADSKSTSYTYRINYDYHFHHHSSSDWVGHTAFGSSLLTFCSLWRQDENCIKTKEPKFPKRHMGQLYPLVICYSLLLKMAHL